MSKQKLKTIRERHEAAFRTLTDRLLGEHVAEIKRQACVTDVSGRNTSTGSSVDLKISFYYRELFFVVNVNNHTITQGRQAAWDTKPSYQIDPKAYGGRSFDTYEELFSAIHKIYPEFLKQNLDRILQEPDEVPDLNRRQRMLMKQQQLIDAGYDAEAKLLANGECRLVVRLAGGPTLKEVVIQR